MELEEYKIRTFKGLENHFPPCSRNNHNQIMRKEKIRMSMLHMFYLKERITCHFSASQSPPLIINKGYASHTHVMRTGWWSISSGRISPKVCELLPLFCFKLAFWYTQCRQLKQEVRSSP